MSNREREVGVMDDATDVVGLEALRGATGEFVTETLECDDGRQVTAYVPPDPPEAVVFASDGHLISPWGGVLEAADVPSTLIVGVHRLADERMSS
jgi:hypothetical protein